MTKEEKVVKKEGEEEVLERFVETVNEFCESADIILKCFDDIYSDYLQGKDIRASLKGFGVAKPLANLLIKDTFLGDKFEERLDKAGIEKEKRDKISLFKNRFSDLAEEIGFVDLEERFGFINAGVDILSDFTFNEEHGFPVIELKFLSGNKELLCLKYPTVLVYRYVETLQSSVRHCLDRMKEKNIASDEIEMLKEAAKDVQKGAKEILDMTEEIEKKGKEK